MTQNETIAALNKQILRQQSALLRIAEVTEGKIQLGAFDIDEIDNMISYALS